MRKIFFALFTGILIFSFNVEAAKVDIYRNALLSKKFTIKYEVKEIPIVQTSRGGMLSDKGLSEESLISFENVPHKGLIVFDGDNSYIEISHDPYTISSTVQDGLKGKTKTYDVKIPVGGNCTLVKDNKLYEFFWDMKNNQKRYFGKQGLFGKSKVVKEGGNDFFTASQRLIQEYNFGAPELARALMPILPPEKILAMPQALAYKFFGSGSLDGGLTYEDFVSDNANTFSAIRYYFNGNDMIKIAQVNYVKASGKISSYEKSVIHITEFSPTPDQNYLKLPEGLKVKRDKEDKK